VTAFVDDLTHARIGRTTNQYAIDDAELDREGGAQIRVLNLRAYLEERRQPRLMLVGEAPSYRGCRFSGLAFTSERSMPRAAWSSRHPQGWQEPSATIVHSALQALSLEAGTLLWNACPTHPAGDQPLSNRVPSRAELEEGLVWLRRLISLTHPAVIIAVGQSAARSLPQMPVIRHPAHGGATLFRQGLAAHARPAEG
jgi:uracil-DNA glycosylase